MDFSQQLKSGIRIIRSRITGKRVPVAVRWNILHRCSSRCLYCNLWETPVKELGHGEILPVLRQLKALGTTQISFSGGEPLLRDDIGTIIDETARLGISPTMNTNGFGIARRIGALSNLDLLKISIDGPEPIHDTVRNSAGSFKAAIEAAEIGSRQLKKIAFATTITKFNVGCLDFILDLAEKYNTSVAFQPLKSIYRGVKEIKNIVPSVDEFRQAVRRIAVLKNGGNRHIRNSTAELERLFYWPDYPPQRCGAGHIFVMIDPDGKLMPCDRVKYDAELPNISNMDVATAIERLPEVSCGGCGFCGSQQLNLVYSFKPWALREIVRLG